MLFGRVLFKLLKLMGLQRKQGTTSPLAKSTRCEITSVYAALHKLHILPTLP
jgi:hypothetical protein